MTHLWPATPGVLFPDPEPARDWLRTELSRPEYQESLLERFTRWFNELVESVREATGTGGGLSPLLALFLLALLVGGIAFALSRLRANPTPATTGAAVFSEKPLTAQEHRDRAHAALSGEQWGDAVIESVRALAAGLVERGLMPEQSGVTVHEISARAAELFQDRSLRLETMSTVFDETRYGDRPADEARARDVVELEEELATRGARETGVRTPANVVPR